MNLQDIKVGDRITFKSWTREGIRKATRIVNHVTIGEFEDDELVGRMGLVGVRYFGCTRFWVYADEIIEHHPKEES